MPRKPRVRPERDVKKIEIERNVIEQFLMDAKDLVKKNRKLVVYACAGLLILTSMIIAALVAADYVTTRDESRFESALIIGDRLSADSLQESPFFSSDVRVHDFMQKDLPQSTPSPHFARKKNQDSESKRAQNRGEPQERQPQ